MLYMHTVIHRDVEETIQDTKRKKKHGSMDV